VIVPLEEAFNMSLAALRRGRVIVLPTDTVYGLAARPEDPDAMVRIFALKDRDAEKSIAVLVGDLDQARALSADPLDRVAPFWPGPLTVIVHRAPDAVLHLGGSGDTVGLRCPDHVFVRRLALEVGPIAASSANLSGRPTPDTAAEIAEQFPGVGIVVDGGRLEGLASTVLDLTVSPPRVLREGPISARALRLMGPADR
jgi:tRNA threonylcarbamoyl adenosine modification protein (Sua5/YciO/YrdC/YwlC family)